MDEQECDLAPPRGVVARRCALRVVPLRLKATKDLPRGGDLRTDPLCVPHSVVFVAGCPFPTALFLFFSTSLSCPRLFDSACSELSPADGPDRLVTSSSDAEAEQGEMRHRVDCERGLPRGLSAHERIGKAPKAYSSAKFFQSSQTS
jgi:hypothetical protein